jgi:hypothetical protein
MEGKLNKQRFWKMIAYMMCYSKAYILPAVSTENMTMEHAISYTQNKTVGYLAPCQENA